MNISEAIKEMKNGKIMEYMGVPFIWKNDGMEFAIGEIAGNQRDLKKIIPVINAVTANTTTDDWNYFRSQLELF